MDQSIITSPAFHTPAQSVHDPETETPFSLFFFFFLTQCQKPLQLRFYLYAFVVDFFFYTAKQTA